MEINNLRDLSESEYNQVVLEIAKRMTHAWQVICQAQVMKALDMGKEEDFDPTSEITVVQKYIFQWWAVQDIVNEIRKERKNESLPNQTM